MLTDAFVVCNPLTDGHQIVTVATWTLSSLVHRTMRSRRSTMHTRNHIYRHKVYLIRHMVRGPVSLPAGLKLYAHCTMERVTSRPVYIYSVTSQVSVSFEASSTRYTASPRHEAYE